ncbi:MAG: phosphatase PAP2 family protein [Solirubrobacteraceae bacterium]
MSRLSHAADHSKLWMGASLVLALAGGPAGRRAAISGLASIAVTSTAINVAIKPAGRRRRPDRHAHVVPVARHVPMPSSHSFPSGHSASAFAFANGVGHVLPLAGSALHGLATAVAYSRVHTGVHYPADVVAGSVIGATLAQGTAQLLERRRAH